MEHFNVDQELTSCLSNLSELEIGSLLELLRDPISDEQIELFIYTCLCACDRVEHEMSAKTACKAAQLWIDRTLHHHPDYPRRLQIFLYARQRILSCIILDVQVVILYTISSRWADRFKQTKSPRQLDRAIVLARSLVDISRRHVSRSSFQYRLLDLISERYTHFKCVDDLNEAIALIDQVNSSIWHVDPDRHIYLFNFGLILEKGFIQDRSLSHLSRAIDFVRQAIELAPVQHHDRFSRLFTLGEFLAQRFRATGSNHDLNDAIEAMTKALEITPHSFKGRYYLLSTFGVLVEEKFRSTGEEAYLNRAVRAILQSIALLPNGHEHRVKELSWLGQYFKTRYGQDTGSEKDLDESIKYLNQALEEGSRQVKSFRFLADALSKRYELAGSPDDINRAIKLASEILDMEDGEEGTESYDLSTLGMMLHHRFRRTGSMDDLNQAITVARKAAELVPVNDPDRGIYLNRVAGFLADKFVRSPVRDYIEEAIEISAVAVNETPKDHAGHRMFVNTLANHYHKKSAYTKSVDDFDQSLELLARLVNPPVMDHARHWTYLCNLGGRHLERVTRFNGGPDDIDRAIDYENEALKCCPKDDPDRVEILQRLAASLWERYKHTEAPEDLDLTISTSLDCWNWRHGPPMKRIQVIKYATAALSAKSDWGRGHQLLQEAVHSLPTLCPRSLQHTDKQFMLEIASGIASDAAYFCLRAGKGEIKALKLLELGRGVIASLLMDMRTDVSGLRQQYPALANKFVLLRERLEPSRSDIESVDLDGNLQVSGWETRERQRHDADQAFTKLLVEIRAQPGFDDFLLPPSTDELMAIADPDPVIVINYNAKGSHAFLIERDRIRALKLPNLTNHELEKHAGHVQQSRKSGTFHLTPVLEWLWEAVSRPCLEALGFTSAATNDNWPRVWWVPTGPLSRLPLHASGLYTGTSTDTVMDRVMSSYALSIKSLRHGRQSRAPLPSQRARNDALLVAMYETPDLHVNRFLQSAPKEIDLVRTLCPLLNLSPVEPPATKENILENLKTCSVFHFAGHGQSDPREPSKSCLLLEDWKANALTVEDLRDARFQENAPFLGYLSACSTGAIEKDGLLDESIHLVSAFQLAGFRHVVGTLWEVSDRHSVDVARVLYETLQREGMTDLAVCRGLHKAVRSLCKQQMEQGQEVRDGRLLGFSKKKTNSQANQFWVPYVHFGV